MQCFTFKLFWFEFELIFPAHRRIFTFFLEESKSKIDTPQIFVSSEILRIHNLIFPSFLLCKFNQDAIDWTPIAPTSTCCQVSLQIIRELSSGAKFTKKLFLGAQYLSWIETRAHFPSSDITGDPRVYNRAHSTPMHHACTPEIRCRESQRLAAITHRILRGIKFPFGWQISEITPELFDSMCTDPRRDARSNSLSKRITIMHEVLSE